MRFARRRWFFAASIGAFVVLNSVAFALAYWYQQSLVAYCERENRATGGSAGSTASSRITGGSSTPLVLAWLVVAAAVAAAVVVAYRRRRESTRSAPYEE
jgi:hypothetical protein